MRNMPPKTISSEYLVLSPTEERVVHCLQTLPIGASVSAIGTEIDLARTSIYAALRTLMHKKLVSRTGFCYRLVDRNLVQHASEQVKPTEQIRAIMGEILHLKRGAIVYSIESDEEIAVLFASRTELLDWQKKVARRGVVFKGIGSKQALATMRTLMDANLAHAIRSRSGSARITGESLKGPCTLISFDSSVIFFSRTNELFYRINDATVARFTQGVMEVLYELLEYHPIIGKD